MLLHVGFDVVLTHFGPLDTGEFRHGSLTRAARGKLASPVRICGTLTKDGVPSVIEVPLWNTGEVMSYSAWRTDNRAFVGLEVIKDLRLVHGYERNVSPLAESPSSR